ncbi:MAG: hypothetical protein QOJ67_2817 [Acidimicrobiaceae bacterium]|jgi:hypothetical protein
MNSCPQALRDLEGHRVCVSLTDGSRIDDCTLVSAGRGQARTIWIFVDGTDSFLHHDEILDLWCPAVGGRRRAA